MTANEKAFPRQSTLELVAEDGAKLVSLTAGFSLYTDKVFSQIPDQLLAVYTGFLKHCPPQTMRYYATENMRRHKPVTKSVFGMLDTWLAPGSPPREYIHIEIKDGQKYQDAPTHKIDIYGLESKSSLFARGRSNVVSMAFPAELAREAAGELRNIVVELAATFPYISGQAGFAFEVSRYESEESQTFAWSKSMRHRGIDIARPALDAIAVGHDALKGVGWLTLVSGPLLSKIGGLAKIKRELSKEIVISEVGEGVVLQAGPTPEMGDTNRKDLLPLYQEVYKVLSPLIQIAASRAPSFDIDENYVEKTRQWYERFADA
jgi:hypothetical protein